MFWLNVIVPLAAILATYLFYPLWRLVRLKKVHPSSSSTSYLPKVSVLFAAFNEEVVLESKLRSVLNSTYEGELEIIVGNDRSTDATLQILESFEGKVNVFTPEERSGKSAIMNELVQRATGEILIATDANIIFNEHTVHALVQPLAAHSVGAVAGQLTYSDPNTQTSTARNEKTYLGLENRIKLSESQNFGFCLGMEGGLYAIRKSLWSPIPAHTFMEDFYQTIKVIGQGNEIAFSQDATGVEDISTDLAEEFKRKIRISIGNFQNLKRFIGFALRKPYPFGYAFLMHKILRWITPLLLLWLLAALLLSPIAAETAIVVSVLVVFQLILVKINRPGPLMYFCAMNLAMFIGMLRFIRGVNSSIWQPTNRNQS